ncbi:hypothetical protein HanXRQr2_Chr12g0539481 [Helianthus annuus]|uniref:Uncharacterized protein n=1 Tax=Helianthus annuus TaxID=4232 RepID=A0A9K3MVV6_HELAN|nr:hypothetical protein HanXRQr2_Chr12g0539481 [Helianthus annuus]KAJ0862527.1 hypothetical protein HanPSC8_Chr12g0519271 [Helianthus annuus]
MIHRDVHNTSILSKRFITTTTRHPITSTITIAISTVDLHHHNQRSLTGTLWPE